MSQTAFVFAIIVIAFLIFITMRGELRKYFAVIGLA